MMILFSIALAICFLICAALGWQIYQLKQSLQQREQKYRRMQQDLSGLIQCMHGVRQRFEKQQKQIRTVSVLQNDIAASQHNNDSNYNQAVLLNNKGASVDELVETCGLSQGEAELIRHLGELEYDVSQEENKAQSVGH